MEIKGEQAPYSKWLAIFLAAIIFSLQFYNRYHNYGNFNNLLGSDVLSYYIYLPFTFIYHDIGINKIEIVNHLFDTYHFSDTFYQTIWLPNGNRVPAYSMGFAILFSPFFFIAHLWAYLGKYPMDGFSYPYQFCIANGVMLYILPGIFIIRKLMLRYFSDSVTTFSMVLVVLGTTYFHEAFNDTTMPHAMMFTGLAAITYLVDLWYEKPTKKISFALGLLVGFVLLCRGSEIVIIFLGIFWNIRSTKEIGQRLQFFKKNLVFVFLIGGGAVLAFLPQLIYWKAMTGDFFFNSYKDTEGVDWRNPNLFNVLFSFRKSLLIYTPMYAVMLIGILMMKRRLPTLYLPFLLFFLSNLYLLSCWAAWWNGYSFGMRYFVESYAVMSIPLAVFSEWMFKRILLVRIPLLLIVGFFVFLNLFQTWQYCNYILDGLRMTKKYYGAIFLKTKVPAGAEKYMEVKRSFGEVETFENPQDYNHKTLAYFNFDDVNSGYVDSNCLDSNYTYNGKYSYRLDKDHNYSPAYQLPYYLVTDGDHAWIRVTLRYRSQVDLKDNPASLVIMMDRYGKGGRDKDKYRAIDLEKREYKTGEWNYICYDYQTPLPLSIYDKLTVYVWHRGQFPFFIDDMKVEDYTPKKID
jgi:hypothetical protein